jgi:hypothetical protein
MAPEIAWFLPLTIGTTIVFGYIHKSRFGQNDLVRIGFLRLGGIILGFMWLATIYMICE